VGMRWIVLALVALLVAPSCAIAKPRRDCGDPKAPTLARSPMMRVFEVGDPDVTDYRLCLIGKHKSMHLAIFEFDNHFSDWLDYFAIGGRYLAFAQVSTFDQEDTPAFKLNLVDAKARRTVRKGRFTRGQPQRVLVNQRGEVGMLASIYDSPDAWVVKFDAGREQVLDHGPDVRALTLKGRTLSWLNGDERRSYTFGDQRRRR
jgi:hypothetical protein